MINRLDLALIRAALDGDDDAAMELGMDEEDCLEALMLEVEQLRAVVDRLPRTTDGVPVVPGMQMWVVQNGEAVDGYARLFYQYWADAKKWPLPFIIGKGCYSTRRAAEAAHSRFCGLP